MPYKGALRTRSGKEYDSCNNLFEQALSLRHPGRKDNYSRALKVSTIEVIRAYHT